MNLLKKVVILVFFFLATVTVGLVFTYYRTTKQETVQNTEFPPTDEPYVEPGQKKLSDIPIDYSWNELEKLVITGTVEKTLFQKNGKDFLSIKTSDNQGQEKIFNLFFNSNLDKTVLTLKLKRGVYDNLVQEWRSVPISEVNSFLRSGDKITVHVEIPGAEVGSLVNNQDLGPILRIVIPI